jgi:hypothetical protein
MISVLNRPSEDSQTRYIGVLIGSTVHLVPVEGGPWQVVDPGRHMSSLFRPGRRLSNRRRQLPPRASPARILFEEFGRLVPIAHYQLPQYPAPHF